MVSKSLIPISLMNQQTTSRKAHKPPKPYDTYPLFPHDNGKWAKKIEGQHRYFGRWDDPDAALEEYHEFLSGTNGKQTPAGPLSIKDACNLFLAAKDEQQESGAASYRTFLDYQRTCKRIVAFWGPSRPVASLRPNDFSEYRSDRLKTCNVVSVGNEVTRIKTMLKWLKGAKYIDEVDVGPDFRKPSAKAARRHRRLQGKKMFQPQEIRTICDYAGIHLKAMILLSINAGFQNADCEQITLEELHDAIATGWVEMPRHKTEVDRRCPLWKSTLSAVRASLKRRHPSKIPNAFVLPNGKPYSPVNGDISKRFRAARDQAMIHRGGFSWLRKTFETVGGKCGDQVAVNYIMGHVDPSMAEVYRQDMQDERLLKVTNTVGRWLFG